MTPRPSAPTTLTVKDVLSQFDIDGCSYQNYYPDQIRLPESQRPTLLLDTNGVLCDVLYDTDDTDDIPFWQASIPTSQSTRDLLVKEGYTMISRGWWVRPRPGLMEFLRDASDMYRIMMCIEGPSIVAKYIVETYLPAWTVIDNRAFWYISEGSGDEDRKRVRLINIRNTSLDLSRTVALNDRRYLYAHTPFNCIPVRDEGFDQLLTMLRQLREVVDAGGDVRDTIRRWYPLREGLRKRP